MMRPFRFLSACLLLALFLSAPLASAARRNPLEGQPAIRHRLELRQGRFEATPMVGLTLLQDFHNSVLGGAKLSYHIFDWLSIVGMFAAGKAIDTGLKDTILDTLHPSGTPCGNTPFMGGPPCDQARDAMNYIAWMGAGQVQAQPFAGKFSLFSRAFFNYDFYIGIGAAFVGLKNNLAMQPASCASGVNNQFGCNEGLKIGPTGSVGVRMFFNDFIALNIEYRAVFIQDNPAGRDVNRDKLVNQDDLALAMKNFVFLGLSFFLPTTPDVSR